jgi:hypothetical protein
MRSIQQAYEGGAKTVGCFYWDDPTVAVTVLLDSYVRAIERENPEFICVDIEQHTDWAGKELDPGYLNDHARGLVEGMAARFPKLLMLVYSAKYMLQYIPKMAEWIDNFEQWTAAWTDSPGSRYRMTPDQIKAGQVRRTLWRNEDGSYAQDTINIKDNWQALISQRVCTLRQYSSRILLPVDRVGGTIYDHQYDWDYTPLTIDEWRLKIGKKQETTMAGINNINVPIAQRGWLGWISYDDKNVDMTNLCAGVDGLFLGMCSQEVSGMVMYKDGAFPIYAARATKPTFAVVTMDQDLFWKKEIDLPKFQGRDMWANETIRAIIDQWRSKPIPENEWNIHKLNITATDGGWLPISALVLYMSTTVNPTHGSPINGMWQQAIVTDITKVLTSLMQGKYIPTVKIMVAANEDWWTTYAADTNWAPLKDGTISGLGIMRMWGKEVAGLPTELGPMATPAATVAELRQYVPADTYAYPEALKKFTFDFFVYSYNRLRAEGMFYSAKTITPLTAAVWRDTPADLVTFLGAATPPVPPVPPVDPTPDLTALTTRVTALEAQVVALTDVINEITLWAYSIPKFQGPG